MSDEQQVNSVAAHYLQFKMMHLKNTWTEKVTVHARMEKLMTSIWYTMCREGGCEF